MNIFYLARDPAKCARSHCDKHVNQMIREMGQMLSAAHRFLDGKKAPKPKKGWIHPDSLMNKTLYKASHMHHPCTVWVRSSRENYEWAYQLFLELNKEFMRRYFHDEPHKTVRVLAKALKLPPKALRKRTKFTTPPQCVPDYCKRPVTTKAYQAYYINEKAYFAKWKNTPIPKWFKPEEAQ